MDLTTRAAFTLFEVAMAILVIAIAVLTMAMFLPAALRVHEQARFQVYAAAKALEMIEVFATMPVANHGKNVDLEAPHPWDIPSGYRAFSPDLEIKTAAVRGPLWPLPTDLAWRIDSRGDEIRRVLDHGGYVYYSNPAAITGHRMESPGDPHPPNEAMKLVITITGAAQQNALAHIPWKGWPYYQNYPSPPAWQDSDTNNSYERFGDPDLAALWETNLAKAGSWEYDGVAPAPFPGSSGTWSSGVRWYRTWGGQTNQHNRVWSGVGWLQAKGQFALALWYAWRKGLPDNLLFGRADEADIAAAYANPDWVKAMRYLAYAGMCLTKHYALEAQPSLPQTTVGDIRTGNPWWPPPQPTLIYGQPAHTGLRLGIPIPGDDDPTLTPGRSMPSPITLTELLSILPAGFGTPFDGLTPPIGHPTPLFGHFYVTHAMIVNYHETCLKMAMRFTAEKPYDLAVHRPWNRALMMDYPLVQYDLIDAPSTPTLTGTIAGHTAAAEQWRPIAAQPFVNPGYDLRGQAFDWPAIAGEQTHFNLTHRFSAAERTREIVFWAVNWTSWEDWETAASAPVDASRYPRIRPDRNPGASFTTEYMGRRTTDLYGNPTATWFEAYQWSFRNPEKSRLFAFPVDDVPTGSRILGLTIGPDSRHDQNHTERWAFEFSGLTGYYIADRGFTRQQATLSNGRVVQDPKMVFSGLFGADRNGNQSLDRGPLPRSVRLQAVEVARYLYYDPRLVLVTK